MSALEPEECSSLDEVRSEIDQLDRKILRLLGRRIRYVLAAAAFKKNQDHVRAPDRVTSVVEQRRQWAVEEGLDPTTVEQVYRLIIANSIDRELTQWNTHKGPD